MARCSDDYGCNCLINVGNGLIRTGSGSAADPYVISLDASLNDVLIVQDTQTINMTLTGSGVPGAPFVLSGQATVRMQDLTDVQDPEGAPAVGDVPVWVGLGAEGHWEFAPPPANPPGAVNVSTGLLGNGASGTPLRVALVGTSAGGTTSGLEVYADSAGNLRAAAPSSAPTNWNDILGKPSFFPTNDSNFSGLLSVAKGGTGASDLAAITVGNATTVGGLRVYVQSATPTGTIPTNSLWTY